ncbi:uncharacterized protein LOC115874870 [Sitophilus oryzae]|uniref:Uncharacterized protein LOC115874870 n=1 Tax=Sitophilus oryzae TaxID=7048 RepID=A0A6J2X509_SITOR|nr:uncharacterized protein LOC115874870 [Sitophilus oryzae]
MDYINSSNANQTMEATKPHAVQIWFPFDKNNKYMLAMTYECFHITQSLMINGAAQALINSTMVFFRAQLKCLQFFIKNFDTTLVNGEIMCDGIEESIKLLIIKYQQVIRCVQEFNNCFQDILLLDYSVISLQLATILIDLYQGKQMAFNSFFFVLISLQLFLMSWNANEIIEESSTGLLNALYESNWYTQKNKATKSLILMTMMRTSRPLSISIGPFGKLTMNAAISRMKLAYSVLSLLSSKN